MFERFRSALFNRQRRKWEKKRKNGKDAFMLYHGVLKWGGSMFVLTSVRILARHQKLHWLYAASILIACPIAGYIWARCTWSLHEDRFYGTKKRRDSIKGS